MTRKLLVFVLCFCLSALPSIWITRAQAEGTPPPSPDETLGNCEGATKVGCETADKDIEASVRKKNPQMTEEEIQAETKRLQELFKNDKKNGSVIDMGSGAEGSGGGLSAAYSTPEFHTLMVAIATGVLGIPFGFTCVNQSSAITFGYASLGFIIGWVVEVGKIKKASERRLTILTDVNADLIAVQVEAINVAMQQTQEAAQQAGTFADIMLVTSVFYGIATSMAFAEGFIPPLDMCPQSTVQETPPMMPQKIFAMLKQSLEIPLAHAEDNPFASLGIENQLKDVFIGVLAEVKTAFAASANNGMVRGVAMSIFTDNDYDAMNIIKDRKKRLEERVKIYQELLKKLKAVTPGKDVKVGDTPIDSTSEEHGSTTITASTELQDLDTLQGSCATGDPKNLPLTADLECKGKPVVVEDVSKNIPVNLVVEVPGSVLAGMKNSKEYASNLANGKPASAELRQYGLNSFATFKGIKKEIGGKLIDYAKKHKKKLPYPSIEEAEKEMRKKLMDGVATVLSQYPPAALSSMMGQLLGGDSPEVKKVSVILEQNNMKLPGKAPSAAQNVIPKIKLDDESRAQRPVAESGPEVTSADALQDLNYTENDITKDTGASIFLLLSNRYRKTAYPLLFEKK
ncbi:MAG: hypothetical protein A2X86_10725 [Bdellovibrionales bacterium GWA2_49_15]|nr:MAG: hypothetical protein A2X86_10725 [Bdellovibrionales bacterium GWA2_49_15]HAZ11449.1 hypothetical protein [Bdellovibrionales bacterium]